MMPSDTPQLIEMLSEQEELIKEFWNVWSKEYIQNLPPSRGKESVKSVKEGDVVLIEEEGPKLSWPLGIVKESIEGRDGCERTVRVKVKRGEVIRPIQRLRKLELVAENVQEEDKENACEKNDGESVIQKKKEKVKVIQNPVKVNEKESNVSEAQ